MDRWRDRDHESFMGGYDPEHELPDTERHAGDRYESDAYRRNSRDTRYTNRFDELDEDQERWYGRNWLERAGEAMGRMFDRDRDENRGRDIRSRDLGNREYGLGDRNINRYDRDPYDRDRISRRNEYDDNWRREAFRGDLGRAGMNESFGPRRPDYESSRRYTSDRDYGYGSNREMNRSSYDRNRDFDRDRNFGSSDYGRSMNRERIGSYYGSNFDADRWSNRDESRRDMGGRFGTSRRDLGGRFDYDRDRDFDPDRDRNLDRDREFGPSRNRDDEFNYPPGSRFRR